MKYLDCVIIFTISIWVVALLFPLLLNIFNRGFVGDILLCLSSFLIGGFIMKMLIKIKKDYLD